MELCRCGCGKEVLKEGLVFIYTHHKGMKDKHHSESTKQKMSCSHKGKPSGMKGKKLSNETKKKLSDLRRRNSYHSSKRDEVRKKISNSHKGKHLTEETKKKLSLLYKLTIEKIQKKYPFFSQIEEMRYNPDKPGEKEIQVHCKNHNCKNSKEQSGWFAPTKIKLRARIDALEHNDGNDGCYFYCYEQCKHTCDLFNVRSDPFKNTKKPYTQEEYQTFRQFVLNRDDYECQFCGDKAIEVHHEKPQKLEPFFALDLDYAWSCCEKCHYKYGHQDGCSTGNLAVKIC